LSPRASTIGPRRRAAPRVGEQGSAMLIVATILTALLAGGGIALYLQLQSTRSTAFAKSTRSSLYCAEAGLAKSTPVFMNQATLWDDMVNVDADGALLTTDDPPWYPLQGDLDDDGEMDYEVTIRDNDADPTTPVGAQAFLASKCIQNAEVPRTVVMLVSVDASGHNYRNQSGGGAGNTGNQN
jgi:hypothetical protein